MYIKPEVWEAIWVTIRWPALVVLGLLLLCCLLASQALAHEDADWIRQGNHKNAAGELCCGERDCVVIDAKDVRYGPAGFFMILDPASGGDPMGADRIVIENVPESEAQPSPDGQYWRCQWAGQRKCFFAPPPTY